MVSDIILHFVCIGWPDIDDVTQNLYLTVVVY